MYKYVFDCFKHLFKHFLPINIISSRKEKKERKNLVPNFKNWDKKIIKSRIDVGVLTNIDVGKNVGDLQLCLLVGVRKIINPNSYVQIKIVWQMTLWIIF